MFKSLYYILNYLLNPFRSSLIAHSHDFEETKNKTAEILKNIEKYGPDVKERLQQEFSEDATDKAASLLFEKKRIIREKYDMCNSESIKR